MDQGCASKATPSFDLIMTHTRRAALTALAGISWAASQRTLAASPPIRLVIPYGGGGMGTIFANLVTEILTAELGTSVYADYKPGANGAVGTELVARAAPDGRTLAMVTTSALSINPAFMPALRYDPLKDFAPVGMVWLARNVLYGNPQTAPTLAALLKLGKSRPLNYGSLGVGSLAHLTAEMLLRKAGIEAVHVPYKGQGQVMAEVAGGRLDFAFTDPSGLPLAAAGRVAALAVTGPARLPSAPQLATLEEQGFAGVGALSWIGIAAPAGTPTAVLERVSAALAKGFSSAAMKAKVLELGCEVAPDMSPRHLQETLAREVPQWKRFQAETRISIN